MVIVVALTAVAQLAMAPRGVGTSGTLYRALYHAPVRILAVRLIRTTCANKEKFEEARRVKEGMVAVE